MSKPIKMTDQMIKECVAEFEKNLRSMRLFIAFDNRPFETVDEMNEVLISNWNKVVTDADRVYILGDFHWGKASEWPAILERLNGAKELIRGNHDLKMPLPPFVKKYFQDVKDYKEIKDGDKNIVLCHYPMPMFKNMYYGWFHLYGHVHMTTENNSRSNEKGRTSKRHSKRAYQIKKLEADQYP